MFRSHQITGAFRPLQDWVILAPVLEDPKSRFKDGILLPERVEEYGRCRVVAVGPGRLPYSNGVYGRQIVPTELKPGQFVYIQKFVEGEFRFRLNGEMVYAIREAHINVRIEDENNSPPETVHAKSASRAKSKRTAKSRG